MILNLAASNFRSLSLRIDFDPQFTDRVKGILDAHQVPYNDALLRYILVGAGYREAGQSYSVSLTADFTGALQWPIVRVWYNLDVRDGGLEPDRHNNLARIQQVLDAVGFGAFVTCSFQLETLSLDDFEPVLELPLIVFNGKNSYFQEISGVQLARLENEQTVESISLDKWSGESISSNGWVSFQTPRVSSELVFTAFGRVVNLQNQAIVRVSHGGSQ